MYDWPIGLSTGAFYDVPICDCLEPILQAGFSMIEVCSNQVHLDYHDIDAVQRARRRIRELNMEAYSFHAPFADWIDITSPDEQLRRRSREQLMAAAQAASTLHARYFVLHPGPEHRHFQEPDESARRHRAVEILNAVADHCRQLGVGLALENMLPHLFTGPIRDLLWVVGAMHWGGVGICLDTGHAHLAGDLPAVVDKLSGHLWMMHINDNHGQSDEHLLPGEGLIDWRDLVDRLSRIPFTGGMILEVAGSPDKAALLKRACQGRLFLRDLARHLAVNQQQRP
jgi:sugar phosphate isomerase/epimerase